ncbi:hypothetical protein [Brevundimonas pishanensis]|uniref:hypothetical protein n=1 Tax=Brevundimonas pishanensis TaxID=2896315 RepID=UPI001FA6D6A0|nr:hypothetical protein [Brevundimonas pishanensis]
MLEPVCLEQMAPFCVSEAYRAAINLDYGYAAALPGEFTANPETVALLGVTVTRAFPHTELPPRPKPQQRTVCHDGVCVEVTAICRVDGLTCGWKQDFDNSRGTGFLLLEASTAEALDAAANNLWFMVNGVAISLNDPRLAPIIEAK